MYTLKFLATRLYLSFLVFFSLSGILFTSPLRAAGQDPVVKKQLPANQGDGLGKSQVLKPDKLDVQTKEQPPSNPLLLTKPSDVDVTSALRSNGFKDYRHIEGNTVKPHGKALTLFGYDFFRSSRELIDAQRESILFGAKGGSSPRQSSKKAVDTLGSGSNGDEPNTSDIESAVKPRTIRKKIPVIDPVNGEVIFAESAAGTLSQDKTAQPRTKSSASDSVIDDTSFDTNQTATNSLRSRRSAVNNDVANPVDDAFTTPIGPLSLLSRNINASIPANYQLSAGDIITIRITSPTLDTQIITKTVQSLGTIDLAPVGQIVVRGQTIESAEKNLEIRLKPFYKNAQVSITASRLRTIQVLITGESYLPGSYSVPAVTTAFNLLNISGGPNENGSLRSIEVRRQGKKIATIDIYKLLTGGIGDRNRGDSGGKPATNHPSQDTLSDVQLQSGDIINIPSRRSRVAIRGDVVRPAYFELTDSETLRDAIAFAGGVRASGLKRSIRIITEDPGKARILKDVDLSHATAAELTLYDGDEVEVFSLRDRLSNRVTIEGAVEQPNDYALQPGMRVSDLLERSGGTLREAYLTKAELHRWQTDNTDLLILVDLDKAGTHDPNSDITLEKWDRLRVYTREEVAWIGYRKVNIEGAVQKQGIYPVSRNMRVSDLLRMSGGPTPDAELEKAFLLHRHDDGPNTLEYVNISAALHGDAQKDVLILDNDRLIIYTVNQSQFTPEHRARIEGEVVNPGAYPRFTGMRVSDLLAFSGGFKPNASASVSLAHARRVVDGVPLAPNNGRDASSASVITIPFDANRQVDPKLDAELEDGDVLSVKGIGGYEPDVQTVIVNGAVNSPGVIFLTSKNTRLSDAIKQAGGLRKEAYTQGAEFYRDPKTLATTGQRSLVQSLTGLNDLLNDSQTKREVAKAYLDLIKATGSAISESVPLGGASAASSLPPGVLPPLGGSGNGNGLVSPARKLGPDVLDPNGLVAINLTGALLNPKSADDVILVNGDIINVPERPTTVQVVGAVFNARGVLYTPGKPLDYYVDLAGGFATDAARDRIEVLHMGGGVIPAKKLREFQPGDIVYVPSKVLAAKISSSNGFNDIFRTLTNSLLLYRLFR